MFRLCEITGQETALEAFVAHYAGAGGFPLDITYARRCRAFAFMNTKGMMAGGFLINLAPPFRSLNDMPEDARQNILSHLDLDETFEAMCFWFSRELRGTFKMMAIWVELLAFLKRFPRRDMLGCTVSKSLLRQYSVVPFDILYQGTIAQPHRTLDKYVFLCRGKHGFSQGILREAWRRLKKIARQRWTNHSVNPALPTPIQSTR